MKGGINRRWHVSGARVLLLVAATLLACGLLTSGLQSCVRCGERDLGPFEGLVPGSNDDQTPRPMHEARYASWPEPDTMFVLVDGQRCAMTVKGTVYDAKQQKLFDIDSHADIRRLYFFQMANDFFVVFSDSVDEEFCHASRINIRDNKRVWQRDIGKCSMLRPVIRGQFCYFVSCGAIGKMRLKDGQYDWHHEALNKEGHYEQFANVDLTSVPAQVLFLSPRPFAPGNDTIAVSDLTGEILRID